MVKKEIKSHKGHIKEILGQEKFLFGDLMWKRKQSTASGDIYYYFMCLKYKCSSITIARTHYKKKQMTGLNFKFKLVA